MAARNELRELREYLLALMQSTHSYLVNNESAERLKGKDTRDQQQYLRGELHAYEHLYEMCKCYLAKEDT